MKLAFCGNDCSHCPRYRATRSLDRGKLYEVALLWNRIGYRDTVVSPEEIACEGCASSNWCRYEIRRCAIEMGVANCGECDDYPCRNILGAIEKTTTFERGIKENCTGEEYALLFNAFFLKKENLERARRSRQEKARPKPGPG